MLTNPNLTAEQISQELLERTYQAYLTRDFSLFETAFSIPTTLRTLDGVVVLGSIHALEQKFRQNCDLFQELGVTDLVRECISATKEAPNLVHATHISHRMNGSQIIGKSYPCYSRISMTDGAWRIFDSEYAIEPGSRHSTILAASVATAPTETSKF